MVSTLTDVLLGQWQTSPKMRALVGDVLQPMRTQAIDALDKIERMRDIDQAEGVWLDVLGRLVGLERPSTTDSALDRRWGFDEAGEPFDTVPFHGTLANAAIYPLPDGTYRCFVLARALLVLGDGTLQTFTLAVRAIDPGAKAAWCGLGPGSGTSRPRTRPAPGPAG